MIEFIVLIIGHIIEDIGFWVMSAFAILNCVLLHYQKKAYRNIAEKHRALSSYIVDKETELRCIVNAVNDFIDGHNYWHDRKIKFYYDQDGWHCCYDDEMQQGDTFTDQEEITQENENKDENQQSI